MGIFNSLFGGGKGPKSGADAEAEASDRASPTSASPESSEASEPSGRVRGSSAQEMEGDEEQRRLASARSAAARDPRLAMAYALVQQLEVALSSIEQRLEPLGLLGQMQGMIQAVALTMARSDKARDQAFLGLRAHLTQEIDRLATSLRLDSARQGAIDVLKAMLPALDDVDLIVREAGDRDDGRHVTSLRMVQRKFRDAITRLGVEVIDPERGVTRFDPATHEGEPYQGAPEGVAGMQEGTVVQVERVGYRVGVLLVRPARVVVVKG